MSESARNRPKRSYFALQNDHRTTAVRHIGTDRTRALREPKSPKFELNFGGISTLPPIPSSPLGT